MVSTPAQVAAQVPLSTGTWSEHSLKLPLKRARSALYPCQAHGENTRSSCRSALYPQNTRSSAPAQHCIHARHMLRTPTQVHPLSTVCAWHGYPLKLPLKRTRSALYPRQAHGKNTRSSAPAQHCVHARHMVRTPVQLSTVSMPGTWSEHPLKLPLKRRSALYPRQAHGKKALYPCQAHRKHGKNTRSTQHCIHARHMVRTPAQSHLLSTVSMPGTW